EAAEKIIKAVQNQPFYLAGSQAFDTLVVQLTQGRVITKVGADGVYAGLVLDKGYAFALKVIDGSTTAALFAVGKVLDFLSALDEAQTTALRPFLNPAIKNWRGDTVGGWRVAPKEG